MRSSLVALYELAAARSRTFAAPLAAILLCALAASAQAPARTTLAVSTPEALTSAIDAGPMPTSQRLSLTLTLAQTPDREAALQQFLTNAITPGNAGYHQWLTPAQFAASYGATADQLAAATAWATAQGLTVDAVSPAQTRLTVSAPVATLQTAFAVSLHTYQVAGALYYANATQPSLPASVSPLITHIDGLTNLPANSLSVASSPQTLTSLASTIDQNLTPILALDSTLTRSSLTASQIAAYTLLFRQANAQGVTLLATRPSVTAAFPALLPEVTAIALPGATADTATPTLPRPAWQIAQGLPADAFRYAPDLTASSLAGFAQTLASIELQRSSLRQGNINPILYQLATTPNLYTQPDAAPAGTWEPATGLGVVDLAALAKAFPRATGTETSSVYITSTNYSPVHGAGFVLTATVYPSAGGTPTGSITFSSNQAGFIPQTVQVNGSGAAVSSTFQLPGGTYPITATYSGDSTFASEAGTTQIFVSAEPANFTLSAPSAATLGGSIAVTATVASVSGIGTPTGSITASLTGAANQTQALTGSGTTATAAFTFTANQAGTLAVGATCTGDASFSCFTPQSATTTVPKVTPTVTLALSTSTPVVGASVTFTVSVTGVTGVTPTGAVNILDNGTQIASLTLPATSVSAPLAAGTSSHSITAVFVGDTNYNTQTSAPKTATTGLDPTTITATAYPASLQYGQTSTFVITIAATSGGQVNGAAPTGTVTVAVGSLAVVTSSYFGNGTVNVPVTPLAVGSLPVTITYSGDANYASSTNTSVTLTVTPFAAVITPQLSGTTFTQGSTQTLTVQFASPINSPVPANAAFTVTFAGYTYPGTFSVNSGGVNATGQVTLYAPAAGTYQIQVACVANADFTCNTPAPITATSTATTGTPPPTTGTGTTATTTTLASSVTSQAAGGSVTLTATVSAAASAIAANAITGTVSFYDGSTLLTTSSVGLVGSNYVATATVSLTGSATHSVTAVYSGNTVYAPSTSNALSISSVASPAAITLTASSLTGPAGQAITFTARVTGSTFSGVVPTGSVTFYLSGAVPSALQTVALGYGGPGVSIATYTTTGLPDGSQTVYAVYSGDGNFAAVTSNNVTIGLSDYTVAFTPATLSLTQGSSGTATLLASSLGNFAGTIAFACTPPVNTGITCSFSSPSLAGAGTTVLTVSTTAAKAQGSVSASLRRNPAAPVLGTALAALLCVLLPGRTRRRLPTLLLVAFALVLSGNLGCSSTGNSSLITSNGGTPLGTAILSISTSGSIGSSTVHHDYSFQVTVQ